MAQHQELQQANPFVVFLQSLLPWVNPGAAPAPVVVGDYALDDDDDFDDDAWDDPEAHD